MDPLKLIFKWIFGLIAAALFALPLAWILLPDETLAPEAAAVLAVRPVAPPDENAYLMLLGLRAAPGRDPLEAGAAIVAQHEQLLASGASMDTLTAHDWHGAGALDCATLGERRCDIEHTDCLATYRAAEHEVMQALERNAPHVRRYRALATLPSYVETMRPSLAAPTPDFGCVVRLAELVDASIAVDLGSPVTQRVALEELARDVAAWRRILRETQQLVTKMVATATLNRKLRLVSEIIRTEPALVRQHATLFGTMTAPLSAAEIALDAVFDGEFRFIASTLGEIDDIDAFGAEQNGVLALVGAHLRKHAYKPNATLNLEYAQFAGLPARDAVKLCLGGNAHASARPWWRPIADTLYNPVGRILVEVARPGYAQYGCRIVDLQSFSRLLELQRRLLVEHVDDIQIGPWVAATARDPGAADDLGDLDEPGSGAPAAWSATTHELSFAGRGDRFVVDGRVRVRVGSGKAAP